MLVSDFKKFLHDHKVPDDFDIQFTKINLEEKSWGRSDITIFGIASYPEDKELLLFSRPDFEVFQKLMDDSKKHNDKKHGDDHHESK